LAGGGMGGMGGMPMPPNLYFSEYVEGNALADAFEIYNATNAAVNLTGCQIRVHYQAASDSTPVSLTGSLPADDVFVVCLAPIDTACDIVTDALTDLSGDDAVELVCPVGGMMTLLDVIGEYGPGDDPGIEWGGTPGTANSTLRRMCNVTIGDRDATNNFNPGAQWMEFAADTTNGLGAYTCPCPMPDLTCP
jgi:hypothetical protein